jgi:hypothetical protein
MAASLKESTVADILNQPAPATIVDHDLPPIESTGE